MDQKILIYIGIILVGFYLMTPVPYCKITEQVFIEDALYTIGETAELKNITATLLNVKGTSMMPAIQDNSQCFCIRKERYEINDIIFFFAEINGQFNGITHRIIQIDDGEYYTKGDGNDWVDPPMTEKSIVCSIPYTQRWRTLI